MFTRKALPYLFLLVILVGLAYALKAASTGEIKGTITDKDTGKPVISASVQVVGTTLGAMTNFEGKFTIKDVIPGDYTVKISHLDYNTVEIDSVTVEADMSFSIDQVLELKVTDVGVTIKVTAKKDIIDKFEVSNQVTYSNEERDIQQRTPAAVAMESLAQGRGKLKGTAVADMAYKVGGVMPPRPDGQIGYPPAHGGSAIVNGEPYDAMFFKNYGVNPFVDTEDDHFSTFAIDVDDASYVMTRSYLERGYLPPEDAVRVEEFVNHFDYNYRAPRNQPFDVSIEGAPSRFGVNSYLVRIGIKGKEIDPRDRKPANLTFVIDVSGSMGREDRLELVKKSLRMLVDQLKSGDMVGIVVYGSTGREILQPTSIRHRDQILEAIDLLQCGGSTYAEQGIKLGYRMADRMFDPAKINRVILCSDGVANVGQTGADAILKEIKRYASKGITLSSIGFGMGNYNDILLEKLGNKGNGYYAYVDDLAEARRVFVDNLTGNLQVIARDVKIQVDFDPEVVRSYRLLGYENRDVADEDFRDDTVDGGEIGSGHSVTALYEIKLQDGMRKRPLGQLFIRYKKPDYVVGNDDYDRRDKDNRYEEEEWSVGDAQFEVDELRFALSPKDVNSNFDRTTPEFRLAACAAEFSEILRNSYWAKDGDMDELIKETRQAAREIESDETDELIHLMTKTRQLKQELADK